MSNNQSSPRQASKKRTKIGAGDVLVISQQNDRYTMAYVLGFWPGLETIMTIALLRREVTDHVPGGDDLARLVSGEIVNNQIMAIISSVRTLIEQIQLIT